MSEKLALARLPPLRGTQGVSDRNRIESFSGQPYRLNGNVHPLPPPQALRPYVDTKAGEVDTWPAHASGLAMSSSAAMLNKNKGLVIMSEEEGGKAPIIPKPRFLEQLENFLKKELRALGVTEVTPSDLRLQAHREVFEYLIEDFKTYKPLMAAIKNEYEMMLAFQRQQIRQLEPLKQMLVTVSEQCDQKIMGLRDEERQEIAALKAENRGLYTRISTMVNEQKDLEEQVLRLQETLKEEHQKYRDECDARKLLINDINDLRNHQEDYLASKQQSSTDAEVEEDPVLLKMALKKAREDEKKASVRLNEMIANYGDVIPRRDYEALQKTFKELEEQNENTQADFRKLQAEHNALLDVQKQVTAQRDQFYLELETLKRSSTPRPDWDKCADYVQGGILRWKELAEGKGSNELVDVLLQEMGSGGFVEGGADYFDGQGTGPQIPKYLQFDGPVRNRHLGKRDTLLLIRDIWREKASSDAERTDGERENLAEFIHGYLTRRFALEQMVVEWGYNLHDACQRYSHDENIGLFWNILNEDADEEVFHEQLIMIHDMLTDLIKVDADSGNAGKLERAVFQSTLEKLLPGVDEETLAAIIKAADSEHDEPEPALVDYKNLFTEDDEGKTGPFLTEIKKWMNMQKSQYVAEIKEQLGDVGPVGPDDMKRAITMVDPEISVETLDAYISWVLPNKEHMEIHKAVERLQNGNIKRIGRKM